MPDLINILYQLPPALHWSYKKPEIFKRQDVIFFHDYTIKWNDAEYMDIPVMWIFTRSGCTAQAYIDRPAISRSARCNGLTERNGGRADLLIFHQRPCWPAFLWRWRQTVVCSLFTTKYSDYTAVTKANSHYAVIKADKLMGMRVKSSWLKSNH